MSATRNRLCLSLLALSCLSAPAFALNVPAGCAVPSSTVARTLYVDPAKGNDANAGTQASPWKSVQGSKIKPGDAVLLMGGSYGAVKIDGLKLASFATVGAAPGQVPVFSSLEMLGSSHWIVQGVKFQALASSYTPFVEVSGNASSGPSSDIILDGNTLSSADDVSAWKQADWVSKGRYIGIEVDGGDANSTYAKCVSLTNNTIKNVRWGINANANDMLIDGNLIQNYGDDGLDFAGNRIVMHANKILDNHDIGDGNHNDAMQGQIGRGVAGTTFDGVVIDGNTVIAVATPGLAFPGSLQGITAFDMDWSNLRAVNNVVVTNTYHGMSFYSLHNGLIANNTVVGTNPAQMTWMDVSPTSHQGTPTSNVILRNNITTYLSLETAAAVPDHNLSAKMTWVTSAGLVWPPLGTVGDHNAIVTDVLPMFQAFDVTKANYDMRLKTGTAAIGTGYGGVDLGAIASATIPVPVPTPTPVPTPAPATPTGFTLQCKGTSVAKAYNCVEADTP